MSILDDSRSSIKQRLLQKWDPKLPISLETAIFQGYIILQNSFRELKKRFIAIAGEKLVIFKGKKPQKFIDFRDLLSMQCPENYGYPAVLLTKATSSFLFLVEDQQEYARIIEILGNYCILAGFAQKYEILEPLGKGHFARVLAVRDRKTAEKFAAKIFDKNDPEFKSYITLISREVTIIRFMPCHPRVARIFELFEDEKRFIVIMELLEGPNLYQRFRKGPKFTEKAVFEIFIQIHEGLTFLHQSGIMHRDIKPENIVFSGDMSSVKIVDFTLAETFKNGETFTLTCGTPGFMAPEILCRKPYDESVDTYSLGAILYILLSGKPPYRGRNLQEVHSLNRSGAVAYYSSDWEGVSKSALSLTHKMLEKDPAMRIKLKDVLRSKWVLRHTDPDFRQDSDGKGLLEDPSKKQKSRSLRLDCKSTSAENKMTEGSEEENADLLTEEGKKSINPGKMPNLTPKFLSPSKSMIELKRMNTEKLPSLMENYSLNSFILSKTDNRSRSSRMLSRSRFSIEKSMASLLSSCPSVEKVPSEKHTDAFLREIDEVFRQEDFLIEIMGSCDTKRRNEPDLRIVLENLRSIEFKRKLF